MLNLSGTKTGSNPGYYFIPLFFFPNFFSREEKGVKFNIVLWFYSLKDINQKILFLWALIDIENKNFTCILGSLETVFIFIGTSNFRN